jgi:Kef-type K+ transport system membrane component KefB
MELVIINIGLSCGIIGPALFAMLVLMTLFTTLMASPLFELVCGRRACIRGDMGRLAFSKKAVRQAKALLD